MKRISEMKDKGSISTSTALRTLMLLALNTLKENLFFYFWLCSVFVAARLYPAAVSEGYSLAVPGFELWVRLFLLWSMASRVSGLQ